MNRWLRRVLTPHAPVATPALVFFSVALLAILQLPINVFIRAGHLSIGIVLNEIVVVAGLPLLLIVLLGFDRRRLLPFDRPAASVMALAVIVTFGAVILLDYGTYASELLFPLPDRVAEAMERVMAFDSRGEFVWKIVLLCLLPAVCEEVFFRGYCQNSIAARWGATPALLITAILFAVMHGNPWYMHLYFLLGLFLSWVFAVTGTLWVPILCHFLNNAWTFLNHARGFSLPFRHPFGTMDAIALLFALAIFVVSALLLRSASGGVSRPGRPEAVV